MLHLSDLTGSPRSDPTRVAETHVSWLVFLGDRVYKAKKPVRFPFLDLSTPGRRRQACEAEVELNRRLAPDVYLGVGALVGPDGDEEPLVVMRRLPAEASLARMVSESHPWVERELARVAEVLAAFHADAERSAAADQSASPEAVARLWRDNLEEAEDFAGAVLPGDELAAIGALAESYVAGRANLFGARVAAGRCRDAHGDLMADDVFCLPDGPRILDCLEFDPRLRRGDVLVDAASLAMDLEHLGRPDLAASFLSHYHRASHDWWPPSLMHHWIAYRALVRAKVACLSWSQGNAGAAAPARRLLSLCHRHIDTAVPRLVLVGGLPGTGKSTVAAGIGAATGWAVLRSDVIRKQLAGVPLERHTAHRFGSGLYRAESTAAVYAELLHRAGQLLSMGQSVVLDASWGQACWREQAETAAHRHHARLVQLHCHAPEPVASHRIIERIRGGGDVSDATPEVASAMSLFVDAWPDAYEIDTGRRLEETLEEAVRLAGRPAQPASV